MLTKDTNPFAELERFDADQNARYLSGEHSTQKISPELMKLVSKAKHKHVLAARRRIIKLIADMMKVGTVDGLTENRALATLLLREIEKRTLERTENGTLIFSHRPS